MVNKGFFLPGLCSVNCPEMCGVGAEINLALCWWCCSQWCLQLEVSAFHCFTQMKQRLISHRVLGCCWLCDGAAPAHKEASTACWIPLVFFLMWCDGMAWRWCAASSWCRGQKKWFEWKLNRNSVCSHTEQGIGWLHESECQITEVFYQMEMWCFISMLSTHEKKHT